MTSCQPKEEPQPPQTETTVAPQSSENDVPPEGAILKGTGSVELKINRVQILSNIELVLIPDEVAKKIKHVRDDRWLATSSRFSLNDGYNNLDLMAIGGTAVENAAARTRANEAGEFTFHGLEPGAYRLYGQYKSKYATGYWLVPVTIQSEEEELEVNLTHENMEEIYNRQIRY